MENTTDEFILSQIETDLGLSKDVLEQAEDMLITPQVGSEEIEKIEDCLNLSVQQGENSSSNKKASKVELIEKIQEIQTRMGKEVTDEKSLKRKSKAQLSQILGTMINEGLDDLNKSSDKNVIKEHYKSEGKSVPIDVSIDVGAKALYNLNKVFSGVLSSVNENVLKDYTKVSIEQYPDKLETRKEELIELYKRIYLEYKSDVDQYLSPLNLIMLINADCCISSIVAEHEKKH